MSRCDLLNVIFAKQHSTSVVSEAGASPHSISGFCPYTQ